MGYTPMKPGAPNLNELYAPDAPGVGLIDKQPEEKPEGIDQYVRDGMAPAIKKALAE